MILMVVGEHTDQNIKMIFKIYHVKIRKQGKEKKQSPTPQNL